jgi:hypothetical protein
LATVLYAHIRLIEGDPSGRRDQGIVAELLSGRDGLEGSLEGLDGDNGIADSDTRADATLEVA